MSEQISDRVLGLIQDVGLASDDLLPSERILATRLKVSRNTLRCALHDLEKKGFIIVT